MKDAVDSISGSFTRVGGCENSRKKCIESSFEVFEGRPRSPSGFGYSPSSSSSPSVHRENYHIKIFLS